eukprot:GHVQ01009259.1.p1 GENE.GHVQ01009259.1~~GHVQ01009259.1.p1  ORF type:complete len:218 (+),score=14.99 GHVQ01009259.1:251-904(+)
MHHLRRLPNMSVRTQPMKSQRGKCRSPLVYLSIGLMGSLLLVGVFCCSTALVAASVDEPPTHRYGLGFTKSSIDEESLVVKQRVLAVEQTTDVGAWANVKASYIKLKHGWYDLLGLIQYLFPAKKGGRIIELVFMCQFFKLIAPKQWKVYMDKFCRCGLYFLASYLLEKGDSRSERREHSLLRIPINMVFFLLCDVGFELVMHLYGRLSEFLTRDSE